MEMNANPFINAKVGDFVKFGRYPQTAKGEVRPVEWQVLSKENGQMLVISRYGLDAKRFDGSSNNWCLSEIRQWLNGEFYKGAFAAEEKALIKSFNKDNVFLLSKEEARKYFANNDARKCKATAYAEAKGAGVNAGVNNDGYCWWWLRSPLPRCSKIVCDVGDDGDVCDYYGIYSYSGSVRPALWINLESNELKESESCSDGSNPFKNANVGDYVEFGCYPQTDDGEVRSVEWQVLSKENGQMLVISRYGLDAKRFDGRSNNWGDSEIRKWLNGEFYKGSFAAEEKALIKSFNQDNVFLLSKEEARRYFANSDVRKCKATAYAEAKGAGVNNDGYCWWWLRSSDPDYSSYVCNVSYGGDVRDGFFNFVDVNDDDGYVRPALWINFESSELKESEACSDGSNPFKNANVGDYVEFGCYPQTAEGEVRSVEWQVLSKENGQMLVISRYSLDAKRFGSSDNWGNSEIRKWLNGEFYNGSFAAEEKALIKSSNQDNVFLLSKEEAAKYFANDNARKCKATAYAKANGASVNNDGYCWWWLHSPYPNGSNYVCFGGGIFSSSSVSDFSGSVRPALWISLES